MNVVGYRVCYDCQSGGSGLIDVIGGLHTAQTITGLTGGVSCAISIAALSPHLPSPPLRYPDMVPISKIPTTFSVPSYHDTIIFYL